MDSVPWIKLLSHGIVQFYIGFLLVSAVALGANLVIWSASSWKWKRWVNWGSTVWNNYRSILVISQGELRHLGHLTDRFQPSFAWYFVCFRMYLYDVCRGVETEEVSDRQLPKSVGCSKNFRGPEMLITKDQVWIRSASNESWAALCDMLWFYLDSGETLALENGYWSRRETAQGQICCELTCINLWVLKSLYFHPCSCLGRIIGWRSLCMSICSTSFRRSPLVSHVLVHWWSTVHRRWLMTLLFCLVSWTRLLPTSHHGVCEAPPTVQLSCIIDG